MNNRIQTFGETARGLARRPLGIIALFIVLVYGLASLVTAFAGSLTAAERLPLVYFLVIFPVLVLVIFTWLVRWRGPAVCSVRLQERGKLCEDADGRRGLAECGKGEEAARSI